MKTLFLPAPVGAPHNLRVSCMRILSLFLKTPNNLFNASVFRLHYHECCRIGFRFWNVLICEKLKLDGIAKRTPANRLCSV